MMRRLLLLLLFSLPPALLATSEPFLVGTKIQNDLESTLSRIFPKEQFLVLVSAEVTTKTERKLVEGEVLIPAHETPEVEVATMPGFLPEPDLRPPQKKEPTRQVYRMVDVPELALARVAVQFDETLPANTVLRAKSIVQNYLQSTYPNRSLVTFEQVPMMKLSKPEAPTDNKEGEKKNRDDDKPQEPEKKNDSLLSSPLSWALLALGLLVLYLLWDRKNERQRLTDALSEKDRGGRAERAEQSDSLASKLMRGVLAATGQGPIGNAAASQPSSPDALRKKLMERFLSRSEAFRIYYQRLSETGRAELCSALKGPALDGLLDGLRLGRPTGDEVHVDLAEWVERHEQEFAEFVQAKDWQDRQFFGFLQQLTDEQLLTLVQHQNPLTVCIMLRFMKANQSALVLEALPSQKRVEILSQVSNLGQASFSELASIEQEVRTAVQRMPTRFYGSRKEDIGFWGSVISEAQDQEAILQDLEKAQPEIYPGLKKFKFKLEDAAALPDAILSKVLAQSDNEELGLALASCSSSTAEVLLDAVSPKRRQFVLNQIESYRSAPGDRTQAARLALTKRFREVLAA